MIITMLLPPRYDERKWVLARQVGVSHAITKAMPSLSGKPAPYDLAALRSIQQEFREAGFTLYGLEGDQFDMQPIKLGLDNRDEWIDRYQQMLRNMGQLGIRLLCYNFMASVGWYRTRTDVVERGGALVSEFDIQDAKELVPEEELVSEEDLWRNLYYFLNAVLPVAQEAGVEMSLHPDDPPVSPLKGVGRILTSAEAFEKIWQHYPIAANKITFCQATFKLMDEDLYALSTKWLNEKRINYLHLRDVTGNKYHFRETFHDNGPAPMAELLQHYARCGFDGPLRPDHAPVMYGESQGTFDSGLSTGYEVTGKIFAIGYIKGIGEASGITIN
ncbi:mannonate dehydratase [Tunicatimonas pelagia]|uniref:mannonate dehydratase n=1 Tax=Tunicatimonas pelagia TaxID=931531 RepID=UPI00266570EB|nr:mannonate dehydratase [Tunicatimonas pelagia]WKN43849.1 mannonate dehydratase [Tunicatimonas pelagia]